MSCQCWARNLATDIINLYPLRPQDLPKSYIKLIYVILLHKLVLGCTKVEVAELDYMQPRDYTQSISTDSASKSSALLGVIWLCQEPLRFLSLVSAEASQCFVENASAVSLLWLRLSQCIGPLVICKLQRVFLDD